MEAKRVGGVYLVRLDPGEEALQSLKRVADTYRIGFATLAGLGILWSVTLGYYDTNEQSHQEHTLQEPVSVLTLNGNITKDQDGERTVHAHVVVGRSDYGVVGGRLMKGIVGSTLEAVVTPGPATIRRRHDERSGLELWDLASLETFQA